MTLSRYYPTLPVVAAPHPHVRLSDAVVSWVGKIGRRTWLRLSTLEPVPVPGAIPLGNGDVLFPMFQGRGSRNALRTHCRRGHVLPTKRNSAGRRQCWACRYDLRRARTLGPKSPGR